jgi:superfamily II DNA or RNA helicase
MKEIILRPYQLKGIDEIRAVYARREKSALLCIPTGGGKTVCAAYIIMGAIKKGNMCFFCVNRVELVEQTAETLSSMGIEFGYICAGMPYIPGNLVYICMVQTLARRINKVATPDFIIWDECRGIAAKSVAEIYKAYAGAKHLGLDATPERPDGKGLREFFANLVMGPSYTDLQAEGALVPFRVLAASKVTTEGMHTVRGEWDQDEVDERMNRPEIIGDAVGNFKALGPGHTCLTFAASVRHSLDITQAYRDAGIPWAHVDGETPAPDRRDALRALRNGTIQGISNVDLFVAGLDVTEIDTVQWLRMTKSLPRFLQGCGRGSRPHPGKAYCTLLDHAANIGELREGTFYPNHGLPDQDREWDLDGRPKKPRPISLKQCKVCGGMVPSTRKVCNSPTPTGVCDHVFAPTVGGREDPESVAGSLVELTPEQMAQAKQKKIDEFKAAKTLDQLIAYGHRQGYKSPHFWATKVLEGRSAWHVQKRS